MARAESGTVDFDHFSFPFEERMHMEDLKATTKKLKTLARWLTLCFYDTEQVPFGPLQQAGEAPRARQRRTAQKTVSIASHRFWQKILDNDSRGLSMDQHPNVLDLFDAPFDTIIRLTGQVPDAETFFQRCTTVLNEKFKTQLVLQKALYSQDDPTIVPYVMPFVDFSTQDGFV